MSSVKKFLRCLFVWSVLSFAVIFTASAMSGSVTSASGLNMRSSASASASRILVIPCGATVTIEETLEGWYKVSYSGKSGYVSKDYISASEAEAPKTGKITASGGLNMRSAAAASASRILTIPLGAAVTIEETLEGWYKVSYSGKSGYVSKDYVSLSSASTPQKEYATVISTYGLNMRSGPGTSYARLGIIPYGARVEIYSKEQSGWCKIGYLGQTAYVTDQYLRFGDTSLLSRGDTNREGTDVQKLLSFAKDFLGYYYVYGGESPSSGFDCSGLVYYVFEKFGYTLPRTASAQMEKGTSVKKADLIPGDLVFFTAPGYNSKIAHVGIYLGSGDFIHASSPGDVVKIDTINSGYYYRNYVGATRIL